MASQNKTIKRWIAIASITLLLLVSSIATVLWSEAKERDSIISEQLNAQSALRSFEIKRPGKTDIKIQAQDNHWIINEPCTIAANDTRLQPLLSIASPAAFSYDAAEVDLEAAGLLSPLATVIANDQRIDIGNTDLSGGRRYARRGERVEFIPEWVLPLLNGGLSALASLQVIDYDITSITVEALTQEQEQVSDITDDLNTWQQLTAQQITVWPLADSPTLKAQHVVTIKSDAADERLLVYSTPAFTAIVHDNTRCAYLLTSDALSSSSL